MPGVFSHNHDAVGHQHSFFDIVRAIKIALVGIFFFSQSSISSPRIDSAGDLLPIVEAGELQPGCRGL